MIIAQASLDDSISTLLSKIEYVYESLLDEDAKTKLDEKKVILARIAQVVSSCAQFIENHAEIKNFCMSRRIFP